MPGDVGRLVRAMGLAVSLTAAVAGHCEASPAAGIVISNTVTAQYADANGATYGVQSNTVHTSVAAVSAVVVSPKETSADPLSEGYPAGTSITRTFTIVNGGNVADAYVLTSVTSGAGTVGAVAFVTASGTIPAVIGTTASPSLQPGESVKVQVAIATANVAVGTAFPIAITARSTNGSTANGLVSDGGKVFALAQPGASIAGPGGPTTSVAKLVDQVRTHTANPGETVTYTILFKNYGGSPATNVVVVDDVPPGITALPSTAAINGVPAGASATLAGQRLTIKAGTLAPGAVDTLTFNATVQAGAAAGASYVNVASLSADGIAASPTTPASVLVGLGNVVYDGYAGSANPVNGATLTLRDFATKAVVTLPPTGTPSSSFARTPQDTLVGVPPSGLAPNLNNRNPYTTGSDGTYSFVFNLGQLGTSAQPAVYELDITAPGYRDRRIQVTISPDASGVLYDATLKELDDQMLATPGGFTLVANSMSLSEVFGLLGNLPMFVPHPLNVSKTVDRDLASGGDRLLYTVQAGGSGAQFGATRIVDTLPAGVAYAPGTARVDGTPVEPQRDGRTLTWTLPSMSAQHTITYACVVMPFVTEGTTLVNQVDVDAASSGGPHVHASATADTRVVAGALGNRIVITGRVFVDTARTGRFRPGDAGVAGVRIYLEDGSSVTTDKYGRFTFPSVHPGQHVLRVDPASLPTGVRAYDDHRFDSTRSLQRLLHGIYDAGLMQDVNFALEPSP